MVDAAVRVTPSLVRELRHHMGLTQVQMAEAVPCHPMQISRWERGVATPRGLYERRIIELVRSERMEVPSFVPK